MIFKIVIGFFAFTGVIWWTTVIVFSIKAAFDGSSNGGGIRDWGDDRHE